MSVRFFILLSVAIFLSAAAGPTSWVRLGNSVQALKVDAANFIDVVTLSVTYTTEVQVCVQTETNLPTVFSEDSCTHYFTTSATPAPNTTTGAFFATADEKEQDFSIPVLALSWTIGFKTEESGTINYRLSGKICGEGEVYDVKSTSCVTPLLLSGNAAKSAYKLNEVKYYKIVVGELVGVLSLSTSKDGGFRATGVEYTVRYEGIPSEEINDESGAAISFEAPLPGSYYVMAKATEAGSYGFDVEAVACKSGFGGSTCEETYAIASNMSVVVHPNTYQFFSVVVNPNTTSFLNVSVGASDKDQEFPRVFIARGQLPIEGRAYIHGCNGPKCAVNVFTQNITDLDGKNQTWFVGVTTAKGAVNSTTFGIWFTGTCAPQCDLHGNCATDGSQECTCVANWVGLDCATEGDGLGPQYIVLIIIASLVVASAIIGFFAWAYMKKKRGGYVAM